MSKPLTRGWEVRWCTHIPRLADNEIDPDGATYCSADFPTREAAFAKAREVFDIDQWGSVRVVEFEDLDYGREWISDAEFFEGDES